MEHQRTFFENLSNINFINSTTNEYEISTIEDEYKRRQLKRQKKIEKKAKRIESQRTRDNSRLATITPLTETQKKAFESFENGKHLFLHGYAGTGKTFISLYLALKNILISPQNFSHEKIIIIRSVVPTRDIGYLPGSISEKTQAYEEPYEEICNDLFAQDSKTEGYKQLKDRGIIEFTTTSFLRGLTFQNAIVIVDEVQNMSFSEMSTIMTRLGENCRIIFCGDFRQSDLKNSIERRGLHHFINIVQKIDSIDHMEFTEDDIVRSAFVKKFIVEWENYKAKNDICI